MKYDFKLDAESDNDSLALMLKRIQPDSVVLEFGCANGRMTAYLKEQLNATVYAVELDAEAAESARPFTEGLYVGDIESYEWVKAFEGVQFDYITFADVLEHLYRPAEVIEACKKVLRPNGSLLLSIPNAAHNAIVMQLMRDQFEYQPIGLLDDTHIRFFTKRSIDQFIDDAGLKIAYQKATFATPEVDLFNNQYEDFVQPVADFLKQREYGEVYQFVIEAKSEVDSPVIELGRNEQATVFFDTGQGFSAEGSVSTNYNSSSDTKIDFQFEETVSQVKQIRIDPCERSITLNSPKIFVNETKTYTPTTYNGIRRGQTVEFHTNDPQIVIAFDTPQTLTSLSLTFESMAPLDGLTRAQLHDEKQKQLQLKSDFAAECDELRSQVSELKAHNSELSALAQSMRLKNRLKSAVLRLIPKALHLPLYYLRRDPKLLLRALRVLRHNGPSGLIKQLQAVGRASFGYEYRDPLISSNIKREIKNFEYKPLISIVVPVYNVDPHWLEMAIESINKQWYRRWELCLVDDCSTNEATRDYLKSLNHQQINVHFSEQNGNISKASNRGLEMATGDYILLMDNDDELTPDALYEVVKTINETGAEFIYSDEDKLDLEGNYCEPHFKPDYSPEQLLSQNYMSHLGVIKADLVRAVGGFTLGLEGAQDYDLYLKVLELTSKVVHIPKVLYHWRKIPGSTAAEFDSKGYAQNAGVTALENHLSRSGIAAQVSSGKYGGTYRVRYALAAQPLVSIIIPFKDKPELLQMCLNSILSRSTYDNFEIIGISNNSCEAETFGMMTHFEKTDERIKFYEHNVPFNYSAINNYAATLAKGEHLLLLNNDIEILTPDWIEELLSFSQRDDIGCVGAKLYYPNDTIQHAGVIIGIGGVAGHSHKYFPREDAGYFSRLSVIQNVSAVTAACLMVKRSIFEQVDGLNEEELSVAFNDVDFCLRVKELGYRNVFTPYCEAYHHESISRGAEDSQEKIKRFNREIAYMQRRHQAILSSGDPHYNRNLSLVSEDFRLA